MRAARRCGTPRLTRSPRPARGVETAQANLTSTRERLNQIQIGGSISDQVGAQAAIDSAQSSLQAAQDRLSMLLNGSAPADRQAAQAAVDSAQSQWRSSRVRFDAPNQPNANDMATANPTVGHGAANQQAAQIVASACGSNPSGCTGALATLGSANNTLAAAQATVDRLSQGAAQPTWQRGAR